jgi:hypothetical protein
MRNLQDVYAVLDELDYAEATYRDVERKIRQAPRLYGVASLSEIPLDLDVFDATWKGRTDALALGFRTVRSFELWRTHVRGAMQRGLGYTPQPARAQSDPWQAIHDSLEGTGDGRRLKLFTLISRARRHGLAPRDLTDAWIAEQHARFGSPRRSSFRQGVAKLNELVAERATYPAIAELLPDAPFALPSTDARRRFNGIELPESFWEDLDAFGAFLRRRKADELDQDLDRDPSAPADGGRDPLSPYRDALSWLVRELVDDGTIDPGDVTDLAAVVDADLVRQAAKRFRDRREAGETKSEASTLHSYVGRIASIARVWVGVSEEKKDRFHRLRQSPSVKTRNVEGISADRETWLRHVVLDEHSVTRDALLASPETLMGDADARLRRWSELSVTERVRTLRYAAAAAQMAVLLKVMAVRRQNLRTLRFRGSAPTLIPPTRTSQPWLDVPPDEVKNQRHLRAPVPQAAWRLIQRWLEVYRPILVEDHPTGHNAPDNAYVFPGRNGPISNTQIARMFEFAVGSLGLGMTMHMARHAVAGLILHRDPTLLEVVADFLGDDRRTVQRNYSFLDTARGTSESQNVLAAEAAKARKRRSATKSHKRKDSP